MARIEITPDTQDRASLVKRLDHPVNYRRFFVRLFDGTVMQIPKSSLRDYLDASASSLGLYTAVSFHEPRIGWCLEVTPHPVEETEKTEKAITPVEMLAQLPPEPEQPAGENSVYDDYEAALNEGQSEDRE